MVRHVLAIAGIVALAAGPAAAATTTYTATLSPAAEVPPGNSTGSGQATVTLDTDTDQATWDVTFSGFSSKAVAAHIHGPAPAGKNAGVVVPLATNPTSPIKGSAKLTPAQARELQEGLMYVNIHTENHTSGAIRGQLAPAK